MSVWVSARAYGGWTLMSLLFSFLKKPILIFKGYLFTYLSSPLIFLRWGSLAELRAC